MYSEFQAHDITVIAVAQEDKDLESHAKFLRHFGDSGPPFEIVADLERKGTARYGRTSTYLIDKSGVVRQVFPQTIHFRADWESILKASTLALETP